MNLSHNPHNTIDRSLAISYYQYVHETDVIEPAGIYRKGPRSLDIRVNSESKIGNRSATKDNLEYLPVITADICASASAVYESQIILLLR